MIVLTVLGGVAFGVVALGCCRYVAGALAWDVASRGERPAAIDWLLGFLLGVIAGALWPLWLALYLLAQLLRLVPISSPKEREGLMRAREAEVARREAKIRRAEWDLGIRS